MDDNEVSIITSILWDSKFQSVAQSNRSLHRVNDPNTELSTHTQSCRPLHRVIDPNTELSTITWS